MDYQGSGLFDRVKNMYNTLTTDGIWGVRNGYNNASSECIKKYGSMKIFKCWVYRKPIESALESVLNLISLNKFDDAKKEMKYDTLYHLGLFVMVGDQMGRFYNILCEKNAVIDIKRTSFNIKKFGETIPAHVNIDINLNTLLANCQTLLGEKYFLYDAFDNNNCQVFCKGLLEASQLLTPELEAFIYQPLETVIKMLPKSTPKIARIVTDLGAWFDRITGGDLPRIGGMMPKSKAKRKTKGGRLPPREQILKSVEAEKKRLADQLLDPQYDAILNEKDLIYQRQKAKGMLNDKGQLDNSWWLKKSEPEKARYERTRIAQNAERNAQQQAIWDAEEAERERIEREKANENPLLDVVTGLVSAVDPTGLAETGINALRGALEGAGFDASEKLYSVEIASHVPIPEAIAIFQNIMQSKIRRKPKLIHGYYTFISKFHRKFDKSTLYKLQKDDNTILTYGKFKIR